MKKIQDTAYRDNVASLKQSEHTLSAYLWPFYTLFAVLFAIGLIGLTSLSVVIGTVVIVHVFLHLRISHFTKWDRRTNDLS